MNSYRKTSKIIGALFLTAMITSLVGGGLLESIINVPDYLINFSANAAAVFTGVSFEFINGIAVLGIAIILYPVLKKYSESMAVGYVCFRIIESIFCIAAASVPLLLLKLSREYIKTVNPDVAYFHTLSSFLISIRSDMAELLIPIFFSLGALLLYYLLFRSKLIPRFIAVWGFAGALLILALSFLQAGMIINIIFVMPIILNEIFLGIWLIVKGFNPSEIVFLSSRTNVNTG